MPHRDRSFLFPWIQCLLTLAVPGGRRDGAHDRHRPGAVVAPFSGLRCLARRGLRPLRSLFGPRATDREIHAIAASSSATTSSAHADGAESAAHDARRRVGPRRVIVRLLPAAPVFAPQTT
jgi:hypothetical protein